METKIYTIDGNVIESEMDFHNQIAKEMQFPNYYGKNLDAFWDCLTDCIGNWKNIHVTIVWLNHQKCKIKLGSAYLKIIDMLLELKSAYKKDLMIDLR